MTTWSGRQPANISTTATSELLEAVFMEGGDKQDKHQRLVRIVDQALVCFEGTSSTKVLWSMELSLNNRFQLIFDHNHHHRNNETPSMEPTLSGIKLLVGETASYKIRHGQQAIIKKFRDRMQMKINQQNFKWLFKPMKKIGKGNFGSVYMAQRLEDSRKVAVKAFCKEASYSQNKGKDSLANEIAMLRRVSHPNIVELISVFESQNSLYMVMEMLEGGHLMSKFEENYAFTSGQVKSIIRSLLRGLSHMHSHRIMHRDLKPQNLILRTPGCVDEIVIADFGLAADVDASEHLFVRCGTPGFVAPEVINIIDMRTKSDPICDMFSAGIIFHMLLLNKSVFTGTTYDQILIQNRMCDFKLEGPEYSRLQPEALNLLSQMLRVNPKERIRASAALKHPYLAQKLMRTVSSTGNILKELQQQTFKSELKRKNSCDRTQPFRLSLNGTQSVHKKQLQMLRDWDKENTDLKTQLQLTKKSSLKKKGLRS